MLQRLEREKSLRTLQPIKHFRKNSSRQMCFYMFLNVLFIMPRHQRDEQETEKLKWWYWKDKKTSHNTKFYCALHQNYCI